MAKLFVAFNFSDKGLLSRKITGFRKRFDPKYKHYNFPHMAMLAPFEIEARNIDDLVETLKEELDTFYYEQKETPKLTFTGIGVYEYKKRNILYLNPTYDPDLEFCSEIVVDICKSFIPNGIKYKENKKQFLPLGFFQYEDELRTVLDQAQIEFSHSSSVAIESMSLYINKNGQWYEKDVLVNFEENEHKFLHLNNHNL